MIERGAYSKNYSRLMLLEAAATACGAPAAGSRSGIDIRGRTRSSLSCRLQPGSMRQRPNAHTSS